MGDDEGPKVHWTYFLFGTLIFFGGMAPVCFIMHNLDSLDIKTGSQFFGDLYYRYYVWSDYLPIS